MNCGDDLMVNGLAAEDTGASRGSRCCWPRQERWLRRVATIGSGNSVRLLSSVGDRSESHCNRGIWNGLMSFFGISNESSTIPCPNSSNDRAHPEEEVDCPVCFVSLRPRSPNSRQRHVEECVETAEHSVIEGNAFITRQWSSGSKSAQSDKFSLPLLECGICYEEFQSDQLVSLLNCFCQFHEYCIQQWFARGKGTCPFHPGR